MNLPLLLGIAVVAATPERAPDGTEARQAAASCGLASLPFQAEPTTVEFVKVQRERAIHIHAVEPILGSGGYVTGWDYLVIPGTCRTVALRVNCVEGHPSCSATILHRPGQPPTGLERKLLLSWLGGDALDARRADHQSARTPALQPLPELPGPPFSITVRAVAQPRPLWLPGPPVPQKVSWAQRSTLAPESNELPEGFVSSGHSYEVHRGDCCVREDSVQQVGPSRLRFFSSPSRPIRKVTYVVLEQPRRNRSTWLASSKSGFHLLGVHQGRAWLEVPVSRDPGFSLLAIDLDTGATWLLGLEHTPALFFEEFRAREVTQEGLVLESPGGDPPQKTLPWELLERALREATPPEK
jgi:hypothetical protein